MTGTLAYALEARGIPSHPDKLIAHVKGTIERKNGELFLTRIDVKYEIRVPSGKREAVERAVAIHEKMCPTSQSLRRGIEISFAADIIEEPPTEAGL
ncbi:MAG: OsmC family protein [Acidobacteria bacterium]|nr:OsmC family protein [Acidobacteriota bacterium]